MSNNINTLNKIYNYQSSINISINFKQKQLIMADKSSDKMLKTDNFIMKKKLIKLIKRKKISTRCCHRVAMAWPLRLRNDIPNKTKSINYTSIYNKMF